MEMPEGVKDIRYQHDAVIQGYQMLMQHNGFFLADVVGLGKTIVATMIAKRLLKQMEDIPISWWFIRQPWKRTGLILSSFSISSATPSL